MGFVEGGCVFVWGDVGVLIDCVECFCLFVLVEC